ncbi:ankyrin repeat-containing domain protein [Cytidiella melzeri]|nr:ankyrin repeat-containing domain protein [Cytidiella melzeri]
MKLRLALASLETLIEHPDAVFAHQVKTSTLAVDICQSIFHMDAIDVVEDYLEWRGIQSDSNPVAAALFGHSSSTEITLARLFRRLTGWTPLEYAAAYHSKHVESLLQRGEDATMGAPVALAVAWDNASNIKPLVEAGARVNAYDVRGMTALHHACYWSNIDTLKALIQCAEHEIDWEARTRDGTDMNALQVAEASPYHASRSTSKFQELFDILRAHIPEPYEELHDGDEPVRMPGSFE